MGSDADSPPQLASWRDGAARSRLLGFLEASRDIDPDRRLAVLDNDGTLWCERPDYAQAGFLAWVLRAAADETPEIALRPEYAAILAGDDAALADLGLVRVAAALVELLVDLTPEEFDAEVRAWLVEARNRALDRPVRWTTYQPMLELLDALRAHGFTVAVVTGGGTEFVRAVSRDLYGVPPELVVGTMIRYRYVHDGHPTLRRTAEVLGEINEGAAKVTAIRTQLGRSPLLAAGNSPGDLEMLELAAAQPGGLALVVEHDDAEREFAYDGGAASFDATVPLATTGRDRDWVVASVRDDWSSVWPSP